MWILQLCFLMPGWQRPKITVLRGAILLLLFFFFLCLFFFNWFIKPHCTFLSGQTRFAAISQRHWPSWSNLRVRTVCKRNIAEQLPSNLSSQHSRTESSFTDLVNQFKRWHKKALKQNIMPPICHNEKKSKIQRWKKLLFFVAYLCTDF